jgi:1-acyl-sn-glycerol-3-phosphate acyltransferase
MIGYGLMGLFAGWVMVPLVATFQASASDAARSTRIGRNLLLYVGTTLLVTLVFLASTFLISNRAERLWLAAGVAVAGAIMAWWLLFREVLEQVIEFLLWPFYRVRAHGPGLDDFPPRGPLLVVANHAAWFDPMFLAKVLPRRLIPMMTSVFYDLPVLRWLMFYVAHAIRVQASTFRRQVPELEEAIAALDRGECVVIFPEGAMRRREEQPLRLFGQGVWHILKERPGTPVVVCWIERSWGCYFSYFNGPPTRNKRMDFARPIDIGVGPAQYLDPAILADQRGTRIYLMQACLESRRYLGLEPLRSDRIEQMMEEEASKVRETEQA